MFSKRTQSVGVPLNGVIFNLGSFAWVALAAVSISNFCSATRNSALNFSSQNCFSCSCFSLVTRSSRSRRVSQFARSISSSSCFCFAESVSESLIFSWTRGENSFFLSFFHCRTSRGETPESSFIPSSCEIRSVILSIICVPCFTAISIST